MTKKPADDESLSASQKKEKTVRSPSAETRRERSAASARFVELRPGLFVNIDHVVSVRLLPQEEGDNYATMQLSSGEKQNITRSEFIALVGEQPHYSIRLPLKPLAQ